MKKMAMICMLSSGLVAGLFIFYQMEICRYKTGKMPQLPLHRGEFH
jgi:hypothetical protein